MNLIQELRDNITLHRQPSDTHDFSADVVIKGIVSENLALSLLKGFSKLSSRWLFINTKPVDLRSKSPLLFGTCILAGLHVNLSLHGTQMHQTLYNHVHGLLGQSHLTSTPSLDTIQAMLIFSMWDLRPTREHDHGNSWLFSGMAAMQVMLTTTFDELSESDERNQARAREILRTWNLICLCHLQFSIGSGRGPIIAPQYLDQCSKVLELPLYSSKDELVLAGIRLYRVLCDFASATSILGETPIWPEIEKNAQITRAYIHFNSKILPLLTIVLDLDSSEPLRFAYSCTYLILSRRTLQHMNTHEQEKQVLSKAPYEDQRAKEFIEFAIQKSLEVLRSFLAMSDLTICIHPAYENLLCSFAMVTLAEFVIHLTNIDETIVLLERVISHIQRGGKAEPVSRWALIVIKQQVSGHEVESRATFRQTEDLGTHPFPSDEDALRPWEGSEWMMDFPSLEDMFFDSMI
ncbi:hypothetical protein N7462_010820 [Penicillium macrosclerotiorum]|uniref:uncharacterized protein n=1 Tax=Penicillium macrosclerotiorum TaxID=303699 RepID=UPI0025488ADC|nr:uncharacterized protein N7462_010820 [Penicillium macrosclerotiorum]KAJ5669750.1 hypothetical protein N7462_010820 [Penicillium macrosclerotiorum]